MRTFAVFCSVGDSRIVATSKAKQTTWLRPLTASLTPPGGNLIRTLTGHTDSVICDRYFS